MPAAANINVILASMSPMPAATISLHYLNLKTDAARCIETRDDEQAVSRDKEGPVSPKVYDTRPDATESAPDVLDEEGALPRRFESQLLPPPTLT